ncbi:hypothetical protein [Bdellovibrio bacteriovorus]|uniref:hypothetical protein n=1 Tax=Bdellovibrio bacteriovorus TaxID=959 RepID=UPI003AA80640
MKYFGAILLPAIFMISTISFAETFDGHGRQTEFGEETCGMIVESTGPSLVVKMIALNQEVTAIVADGDEVNFKVQSESDAKFAVDGEKQTGALKIKASGKIKKGKPVSYQLEVQTADSLMGTDKETIHCKF